MTAPVQLAPADLDELVATIKAAGFTSVSLEPGEVRAPGVWIRIDSIDLNRVLADQHVVTNVTIHLIVAEQAWARAYAQLLPMLDQLVAVLTPAGPVQPVSLAGTASSSPLPALAVPFEMTTIPTVEETP